MISWSELQLMMIFFFIILESEICFRINWFVIYSRNCHEISQRLIIYCQKWENERSQNQQMFGILVCFVIKIVVASFSFNWLIEQLHLRSFGFVFLDFCFVSRAVSGNSHVLCFSSNRYNWSWGFEFIMFNRYNRVSSGLKTFFVFNSIVSTCV